MGTLHLSKRLKKSFSERGIVASLEYYASRVRQLLFPRKLPTHPFDLQNGTDTGGLIEGVRLGAGHQHDIHNTAYSGSAPSMIRGVLEHWRSTLEPTDPRQPDFTFIDIGCGKGRAVLVASEQDFQEVLGVELSPKLAQIAQHNAELWVAADKAASKVRILNADATEFPLPQTPLLIYLFNPFDSPVLVKLLGMLQTAADQTPHPIDIIYAHPAHLDTFNAWATMQHRWDGLVEHALEDIAADAFNSHAVDCQIYRIQKTTV